MTLWVIMWKIFEVKIPSATSTLANRAHLFINLKPLCSGVFNFQSSCQKQKQNKQPKKQSAKHFPFAITRMNSFQCNSFAQIHFDLASGSKVSCIQNPILGCTR